MSLSASNPSLNGDPADQESSSLIMHNNNSSAWRARNAAEQEMAMAKLGASTDTGASARTTPVHTESVMAIVGKQGMQGSSY